MFFSIALRQIEKQKFWKIFNQSLFDIRMFNREKLITGIRQNRI